MSALKGNTKKEENDQPMSVNSGLLTSKPAFSPERSVLEAPMQCPHENMRNSDQADLLKHISFIDSICADGPAKAAYVNGSASPSITQEKILDISKNVPGLLPKSIRTENSTSTPTVQLEDCEPLRKDGEMALRQMVTAKDVENRGIWGFDADSPENSIDSYDDVDELEWNSQKECIRFLLEDQNSSETEAKIPPASSRRKCNPDKIVMLNLPENSNDPLEEGSQNEADPESIQFKMDSLSSNKSQYSNGTAVAFKQLLQKPATIGKNSQKHGYVRENLSRDSGLEEEPELFPSNSSFKDKSNSQTHTKNCSIQKPFICKECGKDFYNHTSLLKHITVHQTNRHQFVQGIRETDDLTNEGKDARLQCPQCTFGTNCPNTFVQHAKMHEKDKRYYPCRKCNFLPASKHELIAHVLSKHPVNDSKHTIIRRQDILQGQKVCESDKGPNSVRNHKSSNKDLLFLHESENSNCSSSSEIEVQQSMEAEDFNILQTVNNKPKATADDKFNKIESKLDKSIHTLISRKRSRDSKRKSSLDYDQYSVRAGHPELNKCCNDDFLNPEEGLLSPAKCKGELFALKDDNSICTLNSNAAGQGFSCNTDCSKGENSNTNHKHVPSEKPTLKKSPSKRKMSTPFHNLQGQNILINFPKCRQIFQKNSNLYLIKKKDANAIHINNNTFRSSHEPFDLSEQVTNLQQSVAIKEECMEMEVSADINESDSMVKNGDFKVNLKSCPYCPAVFQSGIGLSNHVRGHLHRVGVSYKARHVVSVTQVASHDKVPPVRRRMTVIPQIKTEDDLSLTEQSSEPKAELTCPLCREWFDTKTGLSNHVRGHLKRLGKPYSTSTSKSPVIILKELMRDKKQFQVKLQAIEKKCRSRNSLYPLKFSNGLIISTAKVQRFAQGSKRHGHVSSKSPEDKKRTENNKDVMKGSPSSDLIGILKKRRAHEEAKVKTLQTARKAILVNSVKERDPSTQLPNSVSEKSELNRKVCVHCNATFHSGVSLSNHLRAYARRKRNALLEGTTYDCKRKQRSRSGSKKKTHPLLNTPEEIYRLTCRFCDLVFQGPLSVQEDWVKHLQRHIMNTSVPHTGAAMVEVTSLPKDTNTPTYPQTSL